ncbi:hypothetical protein [Photorhabdus luminescens]|uniref:hypothetical protein n=1 Tax=Photorhabdus luminescens TaxID=29488 RepID=UPI00223EE892|nr:hypothetical protein [Photorhabdus luminescens]MCW7763467.1 hypothetical protein [Photorhabdus luminescens subsp. venezuelensis]
MSAPWGQPGFTEPRVACFRPYGRQPMPESKARLQWPVGPAAFTARQHTVGR